MNENQKEMRSVHNRDIEENILDKMHETKISLFQAYEMMFEFFKDFYFRSGKPDNLAGFMGSIQLLKNDKEPLDPAAWFDWIEIAERVLSEKE